MACDLLCPWHLLWVIIPVVVDVDSRCDATDDERDPASNKVESAMRVPLCYLAACATTSYGQTLPQSGAAGREAPA